MSTAQIIADLTVELATAQRLLVELRARLDTGEHPAAEVACDLVSGPQLCQGLGVNPRTLRRWVGRGCPRVAIGGSYRYRLSDVLAWGARASASAVSTTTDDGAG